MVDCNAQIAARLRLWMAESGKGQTQVARDTGICRKNLSHWSLGRYAPNGEAAARLEEYFGKPTGALYAGTGGWPRKATFQKPAASRLQCLCCGILLSAEPESTEQPGLCTLCVEDIRAMQTAGVLRCKDLLNACWEWNEKTAEDADDRGWANECADDAILMAREEVMAEL